MLGLSAKYGYFSIMIVRNLLYYVMFCFLLRSLIKNGVQILLN